MPGDFVSLLSLSLFTMTRIAVLFGEKMGIVPIILSNASRKSYIPQNPTKQEAPSIARRGVFGRVSFDSKKGRRPYRPKSDPLIRKRAGKQMPG
jgi:hypothetical protein